MTLAIASLFATCAALVVVILRARATERVLRTRLRLTERRLHAARDAAAVNSTANSDADTLLRASEERLRLALEAAEMGISDQDLTSDRGVLSEIARRQLGLAAGVPATFENFLACIHPRWYSARGHRRSTHRRM